MCATEVWFAHPNDLFGGWSVMNRDHPPSRLDRRTDPDGREVATFVDETDARRIVELHNADGTASVATPDQVNTYPVVAALTAARRAAGLSQQKVATAMGTRQSAVSELETGVTANPSWSTLVRYAAAVGVELKVTVRPAPAMPAPVDADTTTPDEVAGAVNIIAETGQVAAELATERNWVQRALPVLRYVSAGRAHVDVGPYPDATARALLGELDWSAGMRDGMCTCPAGGRDPHCVAARCADNLGAGNRPVSAGCVFCDIIAGRSPATVVADWPDALAITPRHPVTPGHILVLPRRHVTDVAEDPAVSAATMRRAAELAQPPLNVITSAGEDATQTVFHLHIHLVPRRPGDGLALPWTGQGKRTAR